MPKAHPIPAAIDALVALWRTHPDLVYTVKGRPVPLRVEDGPPLVDTDEPRVLGVGVASQYTVGAGQVSSGYGGGNRRTDRVDIGCLLLVWSGDTDMATLRRDAFDVLDTLGRVLAANRTLGGVVDWARITRGNYQPDQSDAGASTAIDFTVQVDATRFEGV